MANKKTHEESDGNSRATVDASALDRINHILSAPNWSVGMLEDICEIVRRTGRGEIHSDYMHH